MFRGFEDVFIVVVVAVSEEGGESEVHGRERVQQLTSECFRHPVSQ